MNEKTLYPKKNHATDQDFFQNVEIHFEKDKNEAWAEISEQLFKKKSKKQGKIISMTWFKLAVAVSFILFFSTLFLKFYTKTITSPKGKHLSYELPDGSNIVLNAESKISFHPYWWIFERAVLLEGEAFFKVKKGEKFKIFSENGTTEILGTSFNIYARANDYKVFCQTGKVKVSSTKLNESFVIYQQEIASFNHTNNIKKVQKIKADNVIYWKENKFNFTSEPLINVFKEFERQYNVKIHVEVINISDNIYTAYFHKSSSVENSLNLICKTFNLKFKKIGENQYKIFSGKK